MHAEIVFVYKNVCLGGAETLIYRMSKYYIKKKSRVSVVFNNITSEMKEFFNGLEVNLVQLNKWNGRRISKLCDGKKSFFFALRDFMAVEIIQNGTENNILYVVHPLLMQPEMLGDKKILQKGFKRAFRQLLYENLNVGKIIFMDEMCYKSSINYWDISYDKKSDLIFRLPMEEPEGTQMYQKEDNKFRILTVARAAFPFKGYIKGLIEDVEYIYNHGICVQLTVVSYGEGKDVLSEWVNASNARTKSNTIILAGKIDNRDLDTFYANADLYVGMGTTILEASRVGTPSLVTAAYTYEFRSSGYFFKNPDILLAENDCDLGRQFIIDICKLPINNYLKIRKLSQKVFLDMYSVNSFMHKLDRHEIKTYSLSKNIVMYLWLTGWYQYSNMRSDKDADKGED